MACMPPQPCGLRCGSNDCPVFALSDEHKALRQAVRELAEDKIAPRAADVTIRSSA